MIRHWRRVGDPLGIQGRRQAVIEGYRFCGAASVAILVAACSFEQGRVEGRVKVW